MSFKVVSSVHLHNLGKAEFNEVKLYLPRQPTIISHASHDNLFSCVFIRFNDLINIIEMNLIFLPATMTMSRLINSFFINKEGFFDVILF